MKNLQINEKSLINLKEENLILNQEESKKMTGYASIDKPWNKWYPKEALTDTVREQTMWQVLKTNASEFLTHPALIYEGNIITYKELLDNIERVAISFSELGVKSKDNVMLCMPNIPEFIYTFYALIKIGAIPNLIEPRTPAKRILDYTNISNSKYMVMVDLCYENIEKMIGDSPILKVISVSPSESLTGIKKKIYDMTHKKVKTHGRYIDYKDFYQLNHDKNLVLDKEYERDKTAVIVYTSGTSGVPKGVELRNETYNGQNLQIKYSGIMPKPGELFLGNVPFFSSYGSSSGMHNALTNGVTIYLLPSPKLEKFSKYVLKTKANHIMASPRHFEILEEYIRNHPKSNLSYVKNFVSGGDKITEPHEIKINETYQKAKGPKVKKGLGATEHGGGYTTTINDETNKIGSVGIPLPQNIVKIIDLETKEELPYGKIGEIYVHSLTHANGYLNRPDLTEKSFFTDEEGKVWFKTGDLGYIDSDGVVFFVGRISRAIMRPDGHTVSLLPIENAVSKSKYVKECAAIGVKPNQETAGELPMLYVVLNDNADLKEALEDIETLCKQYIPERERPNWFRIIEELPYTLMEKVDYLKLEQKSFSKPNLNIQILDERENVNSKVKKLKK